MAAGAITTPTTGDGGGRRQYSPAADEAARSISRWSRQCVTAGFSFVLWVMSAARASRDHSKKFTLRPRIRLLEKCLQVKFSSRRRPTDVFVVVTAGFLLLYAVVILGHERRNVIFLGQDGPES